MRRMIFALFALLGALISWMPAIGATSIIEEAKREGSVVLYGTMTQADMLKLTEAFEKKYPLVKVKTFRGNNERVLNRVLTEGRAGSYFVDVINLDGINGWVLREHGYLQPHKSAETEAFPHEFRDPEGLMPCCVYIVTNVPGYNTRLVAARDAPRTYTDLLDPKWKGKLGMDTDEGEWFTALISIWGKEKTVNYFRALVRQEPSLRRGHTLLAQLTAAGEFPVAVNLFGYRPLEMQLQGAPIEIVNADPVIARSWGMFLARRAPHPNAGRLFIDYALSVEGQNVIASFGRTVLRPGIKQKHPRLVEGLKLYPVKPELGKDHAEITKLYYSIVK